MKGFEIDNFILYLVPDNLNTCKENEMGAEILIDFQIIRNLIRGLQ